MTPIDEVVISNSEIWSYMSSSLAQLHDCVVVTNEDVVFFWCCKLLVVRFNMTPTRKLQNHYQLFCLMMWTHNANTLNTQWQTVNTQWTHSESTWNIHSGELLKMFGTEGPSGDQYHKGCTLHGNTPGVPCDDGSLNLRGISFKKLATRE